jgi:hypothetical protein
MAVADLNGDGLDDVVVSGWTFDVSTTNIFIFIQNADGSLTDKTSTLITNNVIGGSQRVLIADFDQDGHNDIFIPGFGDGSRIYGRHSVMFWGGATFTRQDWTDVNAAHGACMGDVNNDGKMDLLVAGGGASQENDVGGVYINNGARSFTLNTTMLAHNYFATCAVIKEASSSTIYLGNNDIVAGYRDAIVAYDFNLNTLSTLGLQSNTTLDTVNAIAADINNDGHLDFVISQNGINVPDPGPRAYLLYTSANTYAAPVTLESARSGFYDRALTINGTPSIFFSGDVNNASVFVGTTKYKANDFTAMNNSNSANVAEVYQNAVNGNIYMLELINGTFYTQEMQ